MRTLAPTRPDGRSRAAARADLRSSHAAVLRLQRSAGNRAVAKLMRQVATADKPPQVAAGRDDNEIVVTRADGTRYRVRRRVRAQEVVDHGRARVGFCHDDKRVWMRIAWCEGTQGRIDVGANPQGALQDLLDKALGQINSGKGADDVIKTIENAQLQPFAEAEILKVGKWKISGDVKVDVDRSGVVKATGGLKTDLGWVTIGVDASDDVRGGDQKRIDVTVTIPLEKRTPQGKKCPEKEIAVWWDAECLRETTVTRTIDTGLTQERHEDGDVSLYFDYSAATLRSDPKSGTSQRNKEQLEALDRLVGRGLKVTKIDGYTSPEGTQKKSSWEGNNQLSQDRADAAKKLIEGRYFLRMREQDPIRTGTAAHGLSEKPFLEGDPEGSGLEHDVLEKFLPAHPEEKARMTDDDRKFVDDAKHGLHARAEKAYEYLRRVDIHLERTWNEPLKATYTDTELQRDDSCPADVIEAAERKWGSRIPLTKADPPVC